jgi:DNA adenine methylase
MISKNEEIDIKIKVDKNMEKTKPFLRWAGGKQWISAFLVGLAPKNYDKYFEPFVGGGALFFSLCPSRAVLGDLNSQLIETYKAIKNNPIQVIKTLSQWENESETYYEVREKEYNDMFQRAAQFIYLNKTCWNGLYRVNKRGKFNVPFSDNGREVFKAEHLLKASKSLKKIKLISGDFEEIVNSAKAKDFIYLDPPYTVSHSKNGFRQYNEKLFSWKDQRRLSKCAKRLDEKGCYVIISNAWHKPLIELYEGFDMLELSRHSIIAAQSKNRKIVSEVLFVSKKLKVV